MLNLYKQSKQNKNSNKRRRAQPRAARANPLTHLKYYQIAFTGTVSSLPTLGFFLNPLKGTDANERVGDIVSPRIITTKIIMLPGDPSNSVRIIFFQTLNPGILGASELLQDGPTGSPDVASHYQPYSQKYIKVMYDKTHILVTGANNMEKTLTIRCAPKFPLIYQAGTFNVISGNLQYIIVSDSGIIPHVALTFNSLCWFSD
jgi:hypothetical protein